MLEGGKEGIKLSDRPSMGSFGLGDRLKAPPRNQYK